MVTAAATANAGPRVQSSASAAPVVTNPFVRASSLHREPLGMDVSRVLTGNTQDLSVFDVPAIGYVRNIVLLVQATGGAGTGVVAAEDAPFNVLKSVSFTEPNGAQISQFNTGYELYLANKFGGYRNPVGGDPRRSPVFSGVGATTGNFSFLVRIPVELNLRDALGVLANQNSASTFKIRASLASAAEVYSTPPATLPTVRVRAFLEAWDQPEAVAADGSVNATTPPALDTTQFWSTQVFNVNAGQQTFRLSRVGNYIRNLILVLRRGGTSRLNGDADFPDPLTINLDTRAIDTIERNSFKNQMFERSGFGANGVAADSPGGLENGVYLYDYDHEFDGLLGRENRDLWLPTLGSTRLELAGTFGAAGTLTVLTNDVAVAGPVFL